MSMTGAQFKSARQRLKLTQVGLGEKLELTERQVSRYENGETLIPKTTDLAIKHLLAQDQTRSDPT